MSVFFEEICGKKLIYLASQSHLSRTKWLEEGAEGGAAQYAQGSWAAGRRQAGSRKEGSRRDPSLLYWQLFTTSAAHLRRRAIEHHANQYCLFTHDESPPTRPVTPHFF